MKPSEKQNVIDLFTGHRKDPKTKYTELVKVILNLSNSSPSQKRYYNASRYSPANLASLEYDVKKLCGITDKDLSSAVKAEKKTRALEVVTELPVEVTDILKDIDLEAANYNEQLKPLSKQIAEITGKEPESQKKVDLIAFIDSFIPKGPTAEDLKAAVLKALEASPEEVKESIKLIDEFPFIDDDDCPDEFKILLSDKFKAYRKYKEGRAELKAMLEAGATEEEIFEIAKKTVENFELNLEIYDELNYYKEHGKILGEHPIFADKMLKESVEGMSTVELTKRQKNLRTYVSRDEKAFNKMEDGEAKDKFGEKLQAWKDELELVNARLEKIS
jgi:hypothetical protein